MKIFDLTNPEAARGYDAVTGLPSLEYTPRLFLVKGPRGNVVEADFDTPSHVLASGGVGCDPEDVTPAGLAHFIRTPPPDRLPDPLVVPGGLTEAQAIAAWWYRSIAEACMIRPDSHECLAAVVRSGYDLFTDPLSGERNACLFRAIVMESFLVRYVPDMDLLLEVFPGPEDRKEIQATAMSAPLVDDDFAARYIARTGSAPGEAHVRASLLHRTVAETLLYREIGQGNHERTAEWMNRDALPLDALRRASSLEGVAAVAQAVTNPLGAQALYDAAVEAGNTKLCLALLRRKDAEVDAGGLSVIVKRLQDLEVIYRSTVAQHRRAL